LEQRAKGHNESTPVEQIRDRHQTILTPFITQRETGLFGQLHQRGGVVEFVGFIGLLESVELLESWDAGSWKAKIKP